MRAFYRGYSSRIHRAGQVRRLHIYRDHDGPKPGLQGWCGTHGWAVRDSPPVVLDPMPATPPDGLTWCPRCVGLAAETVGLLEALAARLADA